MDYENVFKPRFDRNIAVFAIILMASSQPGRGRARGRGQGSATAPPPPSITTPTDVSATTSPTPVDPQPTSSTPVAPDSGSVTPGPTDTSTADTGFSSGSSDVQSTVTPVSTVPKGRGRGGPGRKTTVPEDPYWMVTNLTHAQFHSNQRPKKPDELGTLGQQIQVIANYFPILQFPHRGLVYKYQIQIRNKKLLEIHRDRRR